MYTDDIKSLICVYKRVCIQVNQNTFIESHSYIVVFCSCFFGAINKAIIIYFYCIANKLHNKLLFCVLSPFLLDRYINIYIQIYKGI